MPRGNKTGPNGMGPMTGRAAGSCARHGRGRGSGFGPGARGARGAGERYASGLPTKTELAAEMNAEVESLEQRVAWLRREIDALDAENTSEGA